MKPISTIKSNPTLESEGYSHNQYTFLWTYKRKKYRVVISIELGVEHVSISCRTKNDKLSMPTIQQLRELTFDLHEKDKVSLYKSPGVFNNNVVWHLFKYPAESNKQFGETF